MNVSLPKAMQAFLEAEVRAGVYATTSEAVRDAIRLLQERKSDRAARLAEIRKAVALGAAAADRGETKEITFDEFQKLAKARPKGRRR